MTKLFPLVIMLAAGILLGWVIDDIAFGQLGWKTVSYTVLVVLCGAISVAASITNFYESP